MDTLGVPTNEPTGKAMTLARDWAFSAVVGSRTEDGGEWRSGIWTERAKTREVSGAMAYV
jgi:hypothetical protein